MTEKQLELGYWYWDRENNFPPDRIEMPNEYLGQSRMNIACTQRLDITITEQKKLVKNWVELLPSYKNVEILWFTSQTTQELFDSACELENLIGLNIKWSSIKSLEKIKKLKNLKHLKIGSSSQIESIEPITEMTNLEVLSIENFKKISDFTELRKLAKLKFLSIEGGMYTKQKIDSFEPIGDLTNLIYLSTAMVSCPDKRIDFLLRLKNLITLNWSGDISEKDMNRLISELPNLRNFPHRYQKNNLDKLNNLFK